MSADQSKTGVAFDRPAEADRRDGRERVPDRVYYDKTVRLPGYGDRPERCMNLKPVGFCVEHGHPVLGASSCGTRRCPEHWRDWLQNAVVSMVARLAAYRHAQTGAGKRMVHATFSPSPDGWWTEDRLYAARSDAYEVAESVGVRGGAAILHPYRTSEHGDHLFQAATEAGDWDQSRGKWALLRDAADDWEEMERLIEPSPHVHTLAAVEDFDPDGAPSGWVAKNIRSMDRFHYRDVESYRDMARTAWYLLTHGAVQVGRNSTTWFGATHPASFDPEEELTAAAWDRIQRNAELAVTTKPGESAHHGGESSVEDRECPRDGCESEVVGVDRLGEFLDDESWVRSLAPEERRQLQGIQVWASLGDRPPPSRRADRAGILEWLRRLGKTHFDHNREVGLGAFGG